MYIAYRDELGGVIEKVDEHGISGDGEYFFFNDKKIPCQDVTSIMETMN